MIVRQCQQKRGHAGFLASPLLATDRVTLVGEMRGLGLYVAAHDEN
jgi:hypothetical protein